MGLADTVAKGDHKASLEALRDVLAASIEAADPKDRGSLAKQLAEVLAKLEQFPAKEASTTDDLAAHRAKRRASLSQPPAASQ